MDVMPEEIERETPPGGVDAESLYATITNSVLDCIIATDRHGRILEFNPAAEKTFGYSRGEAIGELVSDLIIPPEHRERHLAGMRRFEDTGKGRMAGRRVETEGLHKSGRIFPIEIGLTETTQYGERVWFSVIRDLTETRRMEQETEELSALLDDALEALPNAFGLFDSDLRLLKVNQALADLYGLSTEQLVGRGIDTLALWIVNSVRTFDGRNIDEIRDSVEEIEEQIRASITAPFETELLDGRWLLVVTKAVEGGNFVLNITDITYLKHIEADLREREQNLRSIIEGHPIPIILADFDTAEVLYLSPAAAELYGLEWPITDPQFTGPYYASDADRLALRKQLEKTGRLDDVQMQTRKADGSLFWVSITSRRIPFRGNTAIITSIIDLSEKMEREAEIRRARKILDDAIESTSSGFAIYDSEMRLLMCNSALAGMNGAQKSDLVGRLARDYLKDSAKMVRTIDGEPVETAEDALEKFLNFEKPYELQNQDGTALWVTSRPTTEGGSVFVITDITDLKEVEATVRRRELTLRQILEAQPIPIIISDYETSEILFYSRTAEETMLRNKDGTLDLNVSDYYVDPTQRTSLREVLDRDGQVDDMEVELRRQDGTQVWVSVTCRLIEFEGRKAILVSAMDLTARKNRELALQGSEKRLREIIESLPLPVIVSRIADSQILFANPNAAEMVGYEMDDLLKRKSWEFNPPDGQYHERRAQFIEEGFLDYHESTILRADGVTIPMLVSAAHISYGDEPAALIGFMDLTERKEMEAALKDSEERFRGIAEAHPVAVFIAGLEDGVIRYASPAAAELWGVEPDSLIGEDVRRFYVNEEDRLEAVRVFERDGELDGFETEYRRVDGTVIPIEMTSHSIHYQGEPCCITGIVDLTERKAAEQQINRQREQLYQSEKLNALGALLAGVAHELNNPLSVLVGQALLLKETTDDPAITKRADKIGKAADRCSRIVKTFLSMARQSAPQLAEVDMNEVVDAALEITAYPLRTAEISIEIKRQDELPAIWGDADQLGQVIMNLIVNAQHAMAAHSHPRRLTIASRSDDRDVYVEVSDTGPGIAPDVQARLFEPFFTTKEVNEGTGIGLSVCRGIVEAHDGCIEVESAPGKGARFTVTLPRTAWHSADEECEQEVPERSAGLHVLVVDDEPEVAQTLKDILSADGHSVTAAESGAEAMSALEGARFDLILSDLRMPGMDGPEFYAYLQERWPGLVDRLAFITGDTLGPGAGNFLEEAGRPYLEKPFTPDEVRDFIDGMKSGADEDRGAAKSD